MPDPTAVPMETQRELREVAEALGGKHGRDQADIAAMGTSVVAMLLGKNRAYGSSAFEPVSIFARGLSPLGQIHCRMDDKLARLARGHELPDETFEQTVLDLAGYCILELVARERERAKTEVQAVGDLDR